MQGLRVAPVLLYWVVLEATQAGVCAQARVSVLPHLPVQCDSHVALADARWHLQAMPGFKHSFCALVINHSCCGPVGTLG